MLRVGILGALEVRAADAVVALPTAKARVALALLALRRDQPVSADQLIDAMWPDRLPSHPRAALQTNVARVRKVLRDAGGDPDRLQGVPGGYRLRLDVEESDAALFEHLAERGRHALAAGDPGSAAARLRGGLRLWRGPVLDDLGEFGGLAAELVTAERSRLDELRLAATEDRIDAELALGRHRELVAELEVLAGAHPEREGLWARLAVALYRSDRQVEALDRLHRLADHLADRLGLEPSADIRDLEHRLLTHDVTLATDAWALGRRDARPPAGPTRRPRPTVPLPAMLARRRDAPLIGRSDELERLLGLVTAVDRSASGPVTALVTGAAGIGKTRLVAEVAARAHESGVVVVCGRCEPGGVLPGRPFVEIVGQVLDAAVDAAAQRLGPRGRDLGRLVPDLDVWLPGVERPADVDAGAGPHLLSLAVRDVLASVASDGPLLLVVEDVHWIDELAADLLRRLVADADRPDLVVLLTRRPGTAEPTGVGAEFGRAVSVTEVELVALSADEVSALVDPDGRTSPWFGRAVHDRSGGNPFFALELARHARDRGLVGLATPGDLPLGVVWVVERHVAELGEGARAVLRAAALLGDEFDAALAVEAAGHPDADAGLVAAGRAGVIGSAGVAAGGGRYAFSHAIVRSVLDASLGPGEREAMHGRIAAAISARAGVAIPHAALAHHWGRAGVAHVDTAVEHAAAAAAEAMGRCAYEDAIERCEMGLGALDLADVHDDRRLALLLTAAEAHGRAAQHHAARERAAAALDLAGRLGHVDGFARAATVALPVLPDATVVPALEEAARFARDGHPRRAEVLAALATMLVETEPERADALIEEARELALAVSDVDALHQVLAFDALYGHDVDPHSRIDLATSVLELTVDRRSSTALDAVTFRGTAHLELGDLAAAERDFATHAAIAAELRSPGPLAVDDQRRAMRSLLAGRFDEAEAHLHRAILHVGDDPAWVTVYGAQLVTIRLEQGRFDEVLVLLDGLDARDAARPIASAVRAYALANLGDHDAARRLLDEMLAGHAGWRRDLLWTVSTGLLAEVAASIGHRPAAAQLHPVLAPFAGRVTVFTLGAVVWGSVERFLGPLALLLDRPVDAVGHHERAMAVHERFGAVTFLVRDRVGLAAALERLGGSANVVRARQLRSEAATAAHQLGVGHLVRDVTDAEPSGATG